MNAGTPNDWKQVRAPYLRLFTENVRTTPVGPP
jgi:hypothetical protein